MAVKKKMSASAAEKKRKLRTEDMNELERLADDIVTEYSDLAPSVARIMDAEELTETQRMRALTSFRASLGQVGDPFRDPRYAIANCGSDDSI